MAQDDSEQRLTPRAVATLRARWQRDDLDRLNRHLDRFARARVTVREPLDLRPFSLQTHEGRTDLRGLSLSAVMNCYSVRSVDFSGASTSGAGQLGPYSDFADCRFDRATIDTNVRNEFSSCSFVRANLRRAILGYLYDRCDFTHAVLASASASQATFTRCSFINVDLRYALLSHCVFVESSFEGCRFGSGSLAGSTFTNCRLAPESLVNTILDGATFNGSAA